MHVLPIPSSFWEWGWQQGPESFKQSATGFTSDNSIRTIQSMSAMSSTSSRGRYSRSHLVVKSGPHAFYLHLQVNRCKHHSNFQRVSNLIEYPRGGYSSNCGKPQDGPCKMCLEMPVLVVHLSR